MNQLFICASLALSCALTATACSKNDDAAGDGRQAWAAGDQGGEDEESAPEDKVDAGGNEDASAAGDASACMTVVLNRVVCASDCDTVAKEAEATTCAAGCSAVEVCYAEVATGDIYRLGCAWALESWEGVWRACTDEERVAYFEATVAE